MKSNFKIGKIMTVLLLITMLALMLLSGTYSKYTSSVSGSDTAIVASWKILVNEKDITQAESVTFGLFDTILDSDVTSTENEVKEGYIAPGTSGKFALKVQNASDVTAKYSISLVVESNSLELPIEYSVDGNDWVKDLSSLNITDSSLASGSEAVTTTVYWRWAYEGTSSTNYSSTQTDTTDTKIGISAQTETSVKIKATITATQVD